MAGPCSNHCPSGYTPQNCSVVPSPGGLACAGDQVTWGCECAKDGIPDQNAHLWCDCAPVLPGAPPPPGGSSETVVIGVGVAAIGAALLYLHDRNRGRSSIVHFPNVRHSKL